MIPSTSTMSTSTSVFQPTSTSVFQPTPVVDEVRQDATLVALDDLDRVVAHDNGDARSEATTLGGEHEFSLVPITPSGVRRYETKHLLKKRDSDADFRVPPFTRDWERSQPCGDWAPHVHAEGALYFMYGTKNILTDANLRDSHQFRAIHAATKALENLLVEGNVDIGEDLEIVLDLMPSNDREDFSECGYYIADNKKRSVFWLHEYNAEELLTEFDSDVPRSHMGLCLEVEYWRHYELYSNHRVVTPVILQELKGIMVFNGIGQISPPRSIVMFPAEHLLIDSLTSSTSTSPYNGQQIQELMAMVTHLEEIGSRGGYAAQITGRLMAVFAYAQFLNYHGQVGARLSSDRSIYEPEDDSNSQPLFHRIRSLSFHILNILLLNGPRQHATALEKVWVDKCMRQVPWAEHVKELLEEWRNVAIGSALLFVVNVLGLQYAPERTSATRSLHQEAQFFAASFATVSLITAMWLLRQLRSLDPMNAEICQRYIWFRPGGLRGAGVAYGLPYALSVWAMMVFVVSMFCVGFDLNPIFPADEFALRISTAVIWMFLLMTMVWVFLQSPGRGDMLEYANDKVEALHGAVCHLLGNLKCNIRGMRRHESEEDKSAEQVLV
ncbi:hypothetical protein OE88DRAFT_155567 [Heliocybe sulcata]|uniref:Uncharacterized protein n=1 Tax=Heliocybe sulcata TaxID=5364 RepID=A0A5C3NV76_9AGAM|nr:hypothetical protein OE88DRAFT_155567 [Heliocybe sulcata]